MNKFIIKYILSASLILTLMSLLSGCVTQSFENNEPIVQNQANRDEMAATRVSLGLGYLRMGDMSQAKLNLEKAKGFSPQLVQVHTAFAHYYETVGEAVLAKKAFEDALVIKADSADTLNNYGVFLCRQGQVEEAEVQFLKAIAVPSYLLVSQSYENLSSCYLQNDDFDKAEMYLNKAIFHDPNRINTLLQMVRLQYAMENYREGKRYLQKFERNTQRFTADSLSLAYKLYWKLGQRRTANNYASMLVKMYPQSWEGKQYLLNELEFITADELAKRYQLSNKNKNRESSSSSNKRVVKLSPNKSGNSAYTNSVKKVSPTVKAVTTTGTIAAATKTAEATTTLNSVTPKTITPILAPTSPVQTAATTATTVSTASVGASLAPTIVSSTTQSALATSAGLVSATVAGVAIATSVPENQETALEAVKVQSTTVKNNEVEINKEAPVIAEAVIVSQAVISPQTENSAQPISNEIEPTSTQPIAATRDVPLPEPIPEPVIVENLAAEVVIANTVNETVIGQADEAPLDNIVISEEVVTEKDVELAEKITKDIEMIDSKDAMHTVEPDQNLYNISVIYNIKLNTLRKWNNISENNNIRIGDKLYIVDPQTVIND